MKDNILTTKEVAETLGVHKNTVLKLVKEGRLKSYRIGEGSGGHLRYKLEDVEAFRDGAELGHVQPKSIFMNHTALINGSNYIPSILNDVLVSDEEKSHFRKIIECADVYKIFGQFMKHADIKTYSDALRGQSDIWVAETIYGLMERIKNGKYDVVEYNNAVKRLSIGIAGVSPGGTSHPYLTCLIYKGENGDVVISGTAQNFFALDKGLLVMMRDKADYFFAEFREISLKDYVYMTENNIYDDFLKEFIDKIYADNET